MTAFPPSVEFQLRARLDFAHASHCGPGDPPLSGYQGDSSTALAMRYGVAWGDLSLDRVPKQNHQGQRTDLKRRVIAVECVECEVKRNKKGR